MPMTKEQAIKILKEIQDGSNMCLIAEKQKNIEDIENYKNEVEAIETVLNMLKEQDKEIDILKNKVHYINCKKCGKEFRSKRNDAKFCDTCKKDINKEWYRNLTEEQKARRRENSKIAMRRIREKKRNDLIQTRLIKKE